VKFGLLEQTGGLVFHAEFLLILLNESPMQVEKLEQQLLLLLLLLL